jgi:hypothetical protein
MQVHLNQVLAETIRRLVAQNEELSKELQQSVLADRERPAGRAAADDFSPHDTLVTTHPGCMELCGGGEGHMVHLLFMALLFAGFTLLMRQGRHFE